MTTGRQALRTRVLRAGYFWPTFDKDCGEFMQKCLCRKKHGNVFNLPTTELHNLVSPWPFSTRDGYCRAFPDQQSPEEVPFGGN